MGLEIIGQLKKKKGLTSEQLANQSGVPLGTLNKILNGTTKDPKLETLRAISKVLECTLDDFDDDDTIKKDNSYSELPVDLQDLISKWKELTDENKLRIMGMIDLKLLEQKE